jgi:hypothetical protein
MNHKFQINFFESNIVIIDDDDREYSYSIYQLNQEYSIYIDIDTGKKFVEYLISNNICKPDTTITSRWWTIMILNPNALLELI